MDTPSVASATSSDFSSTAAVTWLGVDRYYVFELLCVVLFVVSGIALRWRRAILFSRQQQRYSRLAQYSVSMGENASDPATPMAAVNRVGHSIAS